MRVSMVVLLGWMCGDVFVGSADEREDVAGRGPDPGQRGQQQAGRQDLVVEGVTEVFHVFSLGAG